MKRFSRYDTSALEEAQFQPGSRGGLKESTWYPKQAGDGSGGSEGAAACLEDLVKMYSQTHRFNASDIRTIHKVWLGHVYSWQDSIG